MVSYKDSDISKVSGHSLRVTAGVAIQRDRVGRTSPKQRALLLVRYGGRRSVQGKSKLAKLLIHENDVTTEMRTSSQKNSAVDSKSDV